MIALSSTNTWVAGRRQGFESQQRINFLSASHLPQPIIIDIVTVTVLINLTIQFKNDISLFLDDETLEKLATYAFISSADVLGKGEVTLLVLQATES